MNLLDSSFVDLCQIAEADLEVWKGKIVVVLEMLSNKSDWEKRRFVSSSTITLVISNR